MGQQNDAHRAPLQCNFKLKLVSIAVFRIEGKSAIHIARVQAGRRWDFAGQHFLGRGDMGIHRRQNETAVRQYIPNQEKEDKRHEQKKTGTL
jgi:putative transposase